MIIKSHIRGGFRQAADYLKEQGENEFIRLVEMSDPHAQNLDDAFRAMWSVSAATKVKKPLHHVSINPMKDERLTDGQVRRICERLEEKYGYAHGDHQRVIVEHVKDGRQHFHVIWNRVSLRTGKPHWPYMHKQQSKIAAREMEAELGLKKPVSRGAKIVVKEARALKKQKASAHHFSRARSFLASPTRHYAGMLGEMTDLQPRKGKSGKTGKGDGAGGGAASALSALKFSPSKKIRRRKYTAKPKNNVSNRRQRNVWVPVERRWKRPDFG